MGGQRVDIAFSRFFLIRGERNGVARSDTEVKGRFLLFFILLFLAQT